MAQVEPLKIDKLLGKVRNRIYLVGIELEGGWSKLPDTGTALVRDGSIHLEKGVRGEPPLIPFTREEIMAEAALRYGAGATFNPRQIQQIAAMMEENRVANKYSHLKIGELPSPPMEVKKFPLWMTKYYPSHVNDTCGLHVHMSFKSALHYQRLMIPEYSKTIAT